MPYIRIVSLPPGEAPEEIRKARIGLLLPLAPGDLGVRMPRASAGVLSGPRSLLGLLLMTFRKLDVVDGYAVMTLDAIAILEGQHPDAAQWWRENVPHLFKPGRVLVFHAS